ncbi:MAG: ATP-binding protein [Planctomycetota bacterium]
METGSPPAPMLSMRDLSHELNSRLDGAIRSLRLAERSLMETLGPDAAGTIDQALARLHLAQDAMRQMAGMLGGALAGKGAAAQATGAASRLDIEVWRAVESLRPLAMDLEVELEAHVDAAAASLDAGPLSIVIHNGLRNAIEACTEVASGRVELRVDLDDVGALRIRITDTGAGLQPRDGRPSTPAGHGVGLDLSRRIVERLGGRLSLSDRPSGEGAVFDVQVPARRWAAT